MLFHCNNGYANAPQCYVTRTVHGLSCCVFVLIYVVFVFLCCSYTSNSHVCCWLCTLIHNDWTELFCAGFAHYLHGGRNSHVIANTLTRKFRLCRQRYGQFAWRKQCNNGTDWWGLSDGWCSYRRSSVFCYGPRELGFLFLSCGRRHGLNVVMFKILCFCMPLYKIQACYNNNNNNNNNNTSLFTTYNYM